MICTFCDIFVKNLKFPKAPKCLQSAAHLLCGHMCHLSAELLYSRGSKFTFVATEQKQRVTKCHTQTQKFALKIIVRIPHLRIPHWGAILRWGILSPSVIRITHPNYCVFMHCLCMIWALGECWGHGQCVPSQYFDEQSNSRIL